MSVSSFLHKNSKLFPSGLNGDEKESGCWQDVLLSLGIAGPAEEVLDPELLSAAETKKMQDFQNIMDIVCSVPAGREVVSDALRANCRLGYADIAGEPATFDAEKNRILISAAEDFSLEDKAAFFVKQCACALQNAETPGMISDAEASVVKAIFVVQVKMQQPETYEKMEFHRKDKLAGMCAHLYSSLNDWGKTAAELFKFCK